eukprot:g7204.t1
MASRPENCAYLINQGLLEHADILYANEPDNEKVRNQVLDLYKAMAENGGQSVAPILMDQKGLLKALPMVAKFVEKAQVEGEPVYEENLAKQIIHMMGHLASTPSLMKRVIKEGGMDVLTRVMAACGPSLEVQMAGLQFMQAAVSTGDPEVLGQLRALGGVNAILKAVELHAANPQIQLAGSGLLAVVAGEEHMGTAIESVGAVIGRMQVAKDQAQMIGELASSISLLTNLIAVEGNADALMSAGVIDQLVNAIVLAQTQQPSQQRTDILNMASGSLVRLLPKDPARVVQAVISKKGLRPMLLAALEENEDLEPLVEYGATTAQACMAEESSLAQLFEDGIGEQMIELSQANPLNDRLLATAAGVVDVLASDEKKAKRLLEHGAAELAVQTGLSNIKEKEDLLTALALMAKLATVPGAIGQLVSAGALDLVLDAMKVHADDAEVMSACADTLAYLMQEESIAVMVGEKKGLNSVMDSLRKYQRDENISYKNLVVLDSLCSVEMNQEILKLNEDEFQTGKLVKTVASNHKDNLQIKNVATNILSMLDDNPEWMQEGLELDDAQAAEMLEGLDNDMVSEDIEQHRAKMIAMKTALANPANAVKVAQQSGLKALQTAMGKAIDDPDIWRAAASAFLSVLDFGEQTDGVLSDDELFGTLCSILGATEKHAKPIPLSDLSKAVRFLAKNRLTPAQVKMVMAHAKDIFNMICKTDDEDLLAQAARLLAKMTNDDANALALAQGVSIRELIYAMRRSFKNTTFLQYGVYLLGNLGCTPALKEEIGIEGGMQLILEIMKEHNKVQPLVESCCYGVATLTFDQFANANFVVAGDGIQTIVDRMDQYLAYYDLLDHAVLSLNNICVDRKQTQVDIVKSGGARAVVDALLQHFDKEEFAVSCLRCLATLSTAPVNIEGIIEGGAIQAMVACMTQFSEALELNALAIAVIGNLAADLSPKNQEIMAAEGAVQAVVETVCDAVVETVNHHQDHVKLQMAVVQCLSNFCKVLQNVETFVGQQGPAAISEVIKTLHNRQYAAHAVRVLLACCKGSEEERESMIDQGVTDVLVEVIKTESGEKPIVGPAVRVLGMLAFNEEMVIKIMNRQNPLPILLVLLSKVYSKDDLVLTDICHTLNQFARNEEATNQMCEMVFKHTETIAGIHNSKRNLVMALLSLLTNIYAHEPCYASIPNTHTTDDILGLITLWKDKKDHAVMKKACNALLNMAYGPGPVKEHMKMRGVLQSMKLLQSENQGTELIVNAAEAVVMALNPMEFDPSKYKDLRGLIAKRSEILNDKPDEEIKTIELDKYTRNLLTDGVMMLKHSKKAVPRQRILKVDQELKWVIWCELHSHEAEAKNMMRVDHVQDVLKGRSTPQLNRKRYGKYLAKDENTLWSLKGRGRTVDFEAESESQREAYANAFEVLIQYKRACRVMGAAVPPLCGPYQRRKGPLLCNADLLHGPPTPTFPAYGPLDSRWPGPRPPPPKYPPSTPLLHVKALLRLWIRAGRRSYLRVTLNPKEY